MPDGTTTTARFPLLPPELPPARMEEEVLRTWEEEGLFDRVDEARRGAPEWVFFEGPPTANGRPGIHHVFSRTLKDLFCRYHVMRGHHVTRKAGWDTHGLPVEIEVEKQLGLSGKQDIERYGVEAFNRLCRESVWKYKDDWERLSARIGYALDYREPYITYSSEYVESVWWALGTLFEKGLLYRGHKILPYCPRCGTSLSSHEVAQGYEDVEDPSVYVALELEGKPGAGSGEQRNETGRLAPDARLPAAGSRRRILVWTTTPWTLVSNVALAVHPELQYVELVRRGREAEGTVILAAARAPAVLGDDFTDRWEIVGRLAGRDLAGWRYRRPLDWVDYGPGEHEVVVAEEFVSAEDGSGVVHMAPAFGADDYAAGRRHGLAFVQPVNARGEFPAGMPVVGGQFVKKADPLIVEELRRRGALWKAGTMVHSYPHCWRCSTPLLYYARESWFVRTTAYRDRMLARNARVRWQPPEVGEGRFGSWLENNIDWALSRDRYWGTPLPVWVCDVDREHVEAVGSYERLAARLGRALPDDFDPHKPHIDQYAWPCAECAGTMRRVPEVIDTWFDSGSMPFAQWHYPFENRERVARLFPADFICEGVDQTRGWFYSLLAIATGLGDALPNNGDVGDDGRSASGEAPVAPMAVPAAAPYKSVVVNDLVLDAEGVKMSKRLGNIVNPWEVIDRHGADAVRMFLVASSQVWVPRRFDESAIRELSTRFLLTLKNSYTGIFAQYANFGWEPSDRDPAPEARSELDRWVLSRLAGVAREAGEWLERLEPTQALRAVMDFTVDDVSNWYVRLSRARFYEVDREDNRAAFATLHEVLVTVSRLLAPFAPFVSDWLHRALTGGSVHLAPFAPPRELARDALLEAGMAHVRVLARLGRAARESANVKVRQPLGRMVCVVPSGTGGVPAALLPLLARELNVKQVEFVASGASFVTLEARPSFRVLGRRFGKATPLAAQAVVALSDEALRAFERGEPVAISVEGESHELQPDDLTIVRRAAGALVVEEEGGYVAALDPVVTPELRAEGMARELVSRVQRTRKEAGLAVSDRIALWVMPEAGGEGGGAIESVVREYQDYISGEVLATSVTIGEPDDPAACNAVQRLDLDGVTAAIAIRRKD